MNKILEDSVYKQHPHLRDVTIMKELATPLTYEHYLGYKYGALQGLNDNRFKVSKEGVKLLNTTTNIGGLYLSGQDVTSAGVTSAWSSCIYLAYRILG